ncbi:hypothetical protein [Nonomuraea sp. NPDC049695]|uniref:hypothetical protein n=1 Tax=Nonomuraea sp. NPDC049695 TaxID=3154734 RepID=UPI003426105E
MTQKGSRSVLGGFAPKLVELTDEVRFGDGRPTAMSAVAQLKSVVEESGPAA